MKEDNRDHLIYALYCPFTNKPVYVGQTKKGMDRPFMHIRLKSHSIKVNEWVKSIKDEGREPIVVILEHDFEYNLINPKEKFWIDYFVSKGFILLNAVYVTALSLINLNFDYLDIDDPLYDIRVYIKTIRKLLKLTQDELSKKSGVGLRFLRELEQGTKHNFNTNPIIKVLECLGRVKLTIKEIKE